MNLKQLSTQRSLSFRIIASVLLVFTLATCIQVYLISIFVHKTTVSELQNELNTNAEFNARELQYRIERLRRDILFVSRMPPIQGIIRASANNSYDALEHNDMSFWKKRLGELFVPFVNADPEYYQVRFVGIADGGREIIRAQAANGQVELVPSDQLQQKQGRDYFVATIGMKSGEIYLSEINLNREFGKIEIPYRRTIRAATPIYSAAGELFGMVVINMDVSNMLDKLSRENADNMRTYLANQNGFYLINPNSDRTFGFDLGNAYQWQNDIENAHELENQNNANKPRLAQFKLSNEILYGVQRKLYFDAQDNTRFLTLTYAVTPEYIQEKKSSVLKIVIVSALSLAIVAALLLLYFIRKIFKPLEQLSEISYAVGEGQYDLILPTATSSEMSNFLQAFHSMFTRIATRDKEIQESNQKLAASAHYANLVIDSMLEAIVIVNAQGIIVRTNIQVKSMFGYEPEELIGQTIEMLMPEEFRENHHFHIDEFFANPSARAIGRGRDLYACRKDGSQFPVEIGLNPIASDAEINALAVIVDITERKQSERQQLQLLKKLSTTNEELNSFTYVASHDLKSPLRGIDQLATWISEDLGDSLNESTQEHLRLMHNRIRRMETLLDDLLEYSRVGRNMGNNISIATNELIQDIFDLNSSNKKMHLVVSENMPVIHTQQTPLELVFRNLINNAIKHHDKLEGTITIDAKPIKDFIEFSVCDDGPGIAPEHQQRIFAMFQTLKSRDQVEGSGIGLALVKKTVESMGGSVRVESDGHNGCCFYFTWPNLINK